MWGGFWDFLVYFATFILSRVSLGTSSLCSAPSSRNLRPPHVGQVYDRDGGIFIVLSLLEGGGMDGMG